MIDDIIASGTLALKQAQVARGRLAFCDAYVFGRSGKSTLERFSSELQDVDGWSRFVSLMHFSHCMQFAGQYIGRSRSKW